MSKDLDWIVIDSFKGPIGAIGFVGNTACVVAAFYDDLDGDKDGRVSWGEWAAGKLSPIGMTNKAVVEVAMAARLDLRVLQRDPSFNEMAVKLFQSFAYGLIADGVYAVYFSRGISAASGAVAKQFTRNCVKQFVIRKGTEAMVKRGYKAVTP